MSRINIALQLTRTVFSSLPPGALQGLTLAAAIVATATACVALAIARPAQPGPAFQN
ncbi:hypothetical protein [Cupriavidus sp. D384]|uniref:hypothetical protein n=1 Tax=Cupriavidus sp. D384 TaxID=1538095 RepID=UPI000AD438B7|nr:hypothetical protein [Cupriavidus sp. D384]